MQYWNNKGKFQNEYNEMSEQLVPNMGPSGTVGGEALRAISRLYYDAYNNGFCNNTSNAWNYLDHLSIPGTAEHLAVIEPCVNTGGYSDITDDVSIALDGLVDNVVEFFIRNPAIMTQETDDDMLMFGDSDVYEDDDDDDDDEWM